MELLLIIPILLIGFTCGWVTGYRHRDTDGPRIVTKRVPHIPAEVNDELQRAHAQIITQQEELDKRPAKRQTSRKTV